MTAPIEDNATQLPPDQWRKLSAAVRERIATMPPEKFEILAQIDFADLSMLRTLRNGRKMADVNGDDAPRHKSWLAANLNAGTAITVGVLAASLVAGWTTFGIRLDKADDRFKLLEAKVALVEPLSYRTAANEAQVTAINNRLDRGFDVMSTSLENLRKDQALQNGEVRKDIGRLDTKVEVLSQRLDQLAPPRARPTGLNAIREMQ
jgi:hypothetical protein